MFSSSLASHTREASMEGGGKERGKVEVRKEEEEVPQPLERGKEREREGPTPHCCRVPSRCSRSWAVSEAPARQLDPRIS